MDKSLCRSFLLSKFGSSGKRKLDLPDNDNHNWPIELQPRESDWKFETSLPRKKPRNYSYDDGMIKEEFSQVMKFDLVYLI